MSRRLALALALAAAPAACGGAAPGRNTTPAADGVRAYAAALRADDPRAAYAMLSEAARQDLTFDDFAEAWKVSAAERTWQLAAIEDGLRDAPDLGERARYTLADGGTVALAREDGDWRMITPAVEPSNATGAADAFRLLAAAIEERDLQAFLRVLTQRRRDGLGKQLAGFLAGLDKHLGTRAKWIEYADRAELVWDDGGYRYKVIARQEGNQWRIDDLDISAAPDDERGGDRDRDRDDD